MEQGDVNWNDWFYYDETSPSCLRWKVDRYTGGYYSVKNVSAGDVAGSLNARGYYSVTLGRKKYRVHRIVYELFNGSLDGIHVDHVNGDRSDNRTVNLRSVDNITNHRNIKKQANNTSGATGVCLRRCKSWDYWAATWYDLVGKRRFKRFSILKLGNDEAFRLACEYRAKMIAELNEQGAGYTDRHGT